MSADEAFRSAYAAHRAAEGRGHVGAELHALPYLSAGPLAAQWRIRARTFDAFVARVLRPAAARAGRPLRLLDLGAGNGWLASRAAMEGHLVLALDPRDDDVDGLGAARGLMEGGRPPFGRVVACFESLPVPSGSFDLVVFNASLHYALDLAVVLSEAARVLRPGGRIAVLDSPFYAREEAGAAMVREKRAEAEGRFGERAGPLLGPAFVEFLTPRRLARASRGLHLRWRRHRVRYPLGYELRPLAARLARRRPPSRFDLWVARGP